MKLVRYSGKRHARETFTSLVRTITGQTQPCRGTIDASTGAVTWWHGGAPRPIKAPPCVLGAARGCRQRGCTD